MRGSAHAGVDRGLQEKEGEWYHLHVGLVVCMLLVWLSAYKFLKKKQILCPPQAAPYDKAASLRLRTPFALIHLCQEKTGKTEETLRQDSDEKRWGAGGSDKEDSRDNYSI